MGDHISTYKDYVAGMAAGVATVIIGHPFDTVKVKLQKHNTEAHGVKYRSALHCTTRILKNEGQTKKSLQGELNSSKPQLRFIIPSAAYGGAIISLVLCSSELVKCRMQVQGTDSLVGKCDKYSSPLDCAVKTIKSEGYWSVVLPFDVAKTVIQTAPDSTSSRNPFRILSSIYRMKGIKGCYTGIGPTLVRAFPANAAAIVAWELTAKLLGIRCD
ncbi:PREDICTED: mitochondrial arginine transporter BAC1 [Nelumbo nucifera]|uniref:Mitochondrial arginine transporter BAC1 n=1 Tax=Nelumbo nucifera TaxID=4432 RepID=A0A1U8Q6I4_NELNU|nr:PREDICTED: mitochondrial arginine transporter BAC1 [Nelumbo nucifera]